MERIGDLKLDQDTKVQRWAWRVERVGWGLIALVIILALLGAFSTGPLSSATVGDMQTGVAVDYQRFLRNEGEASLEVEVAPDQVADGQIEFWVDADYLDKVSGLEVEPTPDEVRLVNSRHVFVFLAEPGNEPLRLSFSFQPETIGTLSGNAGVVDGPSVSFWQFSYP